MGFFGAIKMWMIIVSLVGALGTAGYYVFQYKTLTSQNALVVAEKATVENDLSNCIDLNGGLGIQLGVQNNRILAANEQHRKEITDTVAYFELLKETIIRQAASNKQLRNQLDTVRKNTQEVFHKLSLDYDVIPERENYDNDNIEPDEDYEYDEEE